MRAEIESSPVNLYLLSDGNEPKTKRGLVLWSGFL